MRPTREDTAAVEARILYWGIEGAGKTANLVTIHRRLRPDHRGELQVIPTPTDPTVSYEVLPIELGEVRGVRTKLQIIAVPGSPEQAPTRKLLLDGIDGLVFVADAQRHRIDENLASFQELRRSLLAYGLSLESIPIVVQYNKHDLADPVGLEELYRKLDVKGAAVFETVATEGGGPLRTLTTISKRVMRRLRDGRVTPTALASSLDVGASGGSLAESASDLLERAILAEAAPSGAERSVDGLLRAEEILDQPWDEFEPLAEAEDDSAPPRDLRILSLGRASRIDAHAIRVPLVLGDGEGEELRLALTVRLDPLLDGQEEDT